MPRTPYLFPVGSRLGTDNLVLHARSANHRVDNFAGPLSIKTVISGQVAWTIQGRDLVVDPSSFLVEILGLEILGKPGEVTLLKAGDVTIVLNRPAGPTAVEAYEIMPGMWAATFTDPDGHLLTLLGPQ